MAWAFRLSILIFLLFSQFAAAQTRCSQLFGSIHLTNSKYATEKDIEIQITDLFAQLSKNKLNYLTNGADIVSVDHVEIFKKSETSLQPALLVTSKISNENAVLSIYKGDVYFSHYYYSKYGAPYVKTRKPLNEFAQSAPWFKWNEKTRTYSLETSGLVENIVNKVFGSKEMIKLYRGTNQSEAEFMQAIAQMSDQDAAAVAQKKFRSGAHKGFFFTEQKSAAKKWSKDKTVVSVDIPREVVLQLAREGRMYAGVEGGYFEFMFFDPASIKGLANLYQIEK